MIEFQLPFRMNKIVFKIIFLELLFICSSFFCNAQVLKSIVYDFDGLDISQTDLPEGDYSVNDLAYSIAANPLTASDMLGDRVLKLNLNWSAGNGVFGRGISRYIEFDPINDKFNFYFYNPLSNNQNATFDVVITDDDNQNNTYELSADDTWKKSLVIPGTTGWQLISIPLSDFVDSNIGGNGIFDIDFTANKGMLLMVEFRFTENTQGLSNATFYLDMINFTEGDLPRGSTAFDLPQKSISDYCFLGAFQDNQRGSEYLIPSEVEGLFPAASGKKLKYANFFLQFGMDGTAVAKTLPGSEVQTLINNGYKPIITWEPMFQGYSRLDVHQPRLSNIINGDYNTYIDQFADKIKTYTDTVIIRFMHEFEGNWYSWSLTENNHDPNLYVSAFRSVVDRFRARGVNNVKWMWCVNSDYFPYLPYNWIVPAYPGDNYVDIIAEDIYNNHYPTALPWWRSFRWQLTENYYYLTKYFPSKPLFICELGCRERLSSENPSSQSKGQWFAAMDKELEADYRKARALVFFNSSPDQNWFLNSSSSALQSLTDNIWNNNYYFSAPGSPLSVTITSPGKNTLFVAGGNVTITAAATGGGGAIKKIEFFSGAVKLGEDSISPYNFTLNNIQTGSYILTAKVTGSNGSTAISPAINIAAGNCSATGTILREVWNGINGTSVSSIPLSSSASSSSNLTIFEAPTNVADNYGQRIKGYLCPPATGNYVFWIASDDNSELWLSTNDVPANKQKIASVNDWTFPREWTKYPSQQSTSINLNVGQKYYIEALHKEGAQGDNLAVGWQLPDGTLERPIPGLRLSPYILPWTTSITSPVNNSSFAVGANIAITATTSGNTVSIKKIEFFSGATKIAEDSISPYSFNWTSVPAGNYSLTVKATDNALNTAVSQAVNITVAATCNASGIISREIWYGVTGTGVSKIPVSTIPSSVSTLSTFEAPTNIGDNYGQHIRGYICAPVTGNYIFNIASDDNSELWLSTNELPANKRKIAYVNGFTAPREWTKYTTQQSALINLVAGQKYYIEALHKEGTQSDNLAVGWQLPDGQLERPITGTRLSEYSIPNNTCAGSIQPNSATTFCSGGNVVLSANTGSGFSYQWAKNFSNINGATSANYTASSNGDYQVKISSPGCTTWSAPITVAINTSLIAKITAKGSTSFCPGSSVTLFANTCSGYIYQWKKNGTDISGATNSSYVATDSDSYQVKIIQGASVAWSALINVTLNPCRETENMQNDSIISENIVAANDDFKINVYPNPSTGLFTFEINHEIKETINLESNIPAGIYFLQIKIGNQIENTKIVLNK
jgi:hypothetical protein